jgi:hypothetical protein
MEANATMILKTPNPPRLPNNQQRLTVIGATGSGKTQCALWHLSHRDYHAMPWIVYNTKGDESIDSIPYIQDVGLDEIPTKPGVYVCRPLPDEDDDKVEAQMRAIWARGRMGVYVDEGYMISNNNRAFRALLTQGRSKYVPMITLGQRPVWLDRFVFSESEFFQVFRLQTAKDRKAMSEVIPTSLEQPLPEFHSWYYDAGQNNLTVMRPVSSIQAIHGTFSRRLSEIARRRKRVV